MRKGKIALLLVFVMLLGVFQGVTPIITYAGTEVNESKQLINLIVDEVAQLQMDFQPEKRAYGDYNAYMSVKELHIWAVPEAKGKIVTVNGISPKITGGELPKPANDYGRVTIPFDETYRDTNRPEVNGKAAVTIQVEGGDPYTFTIYRVNEDYRGRKQLPIIGATASSSATNPNYQPEWAYDGDIFGTDGKGWKPLDTFEDTGKTTSVKQGSMSDGKVSNVAGHYITFELDKPYVVSRATGFWDIRNGQGMTHWRTVGGDIWRYLLEISVSIDGENFQTVADMANFRDRRPYFGYNSNNVMVSTTDPTEPFTRYEFDDNYEAKYVRFKFKQYEYTNQVSVPKLKEAFIYGWDVNDSRIPQASQVPVNKTPYVPTNPNISRANEMMMENGMEISTWVPSGDYGRGTYDAKEWQNTNMSSIILYDVPFQITKFMKYIPNAKWGLAKAPTGLNGITGAGEPKDFIPEEMKPYIANATTFCFGDERDLTGQEITGFKKWFDFSKANYPHVLLHTNQTGQQAQDYTKLRSYIVNAKPDMLTMDSYPWSGGGMGNVGGILGNTKQLLDRATYQRKAALEGIEGDGSKPLVFGQYISSYNREYSKSQKNVVGYLSLAAGMKWFDMWRSEFAFDDGNTFDYDGTPKRGLLEWSQLFKEMRNIEDYLIRLNSDTVVTVPGQNQSGVSNGVTTRQAANGVGAVGAFSSNIAKNREYYIESVQVENISKYNLNNGKPGDVVLGYFKTLPGLTSEQIKTQFQVDEVKAFMVVNGFYNGMDNEHGKISPEPVGDYTSHSPSGIYANVMNRIQEDYGSERETEQRITVTFTADAPDTLMKVSKESKNVATPVDLTINEDGTKSMTVIMGGGTGDLYYWGKGAERYQTTINDTKIGNGNNQIQYGYYDDSNFDFTDIAPKQLDNSKINTTKSGEWMYREPVSNTNDFPAYERDIHFTFKPKDVAVIKFKGDRLRLVGRKSNNGGYGHMFIDNEYKGTIDQYIEGSNKLYEEELFDSDNAVGNKLVEKEHTAVILIENGRDKAGMYEQFNVDKIEIYSRVLAATGGTEGVATYVDSHTTGNDLNQIQYSGNWIASKRQPRETNSDYYTSNDVNAKFSMKFKGDSVELFAPANITANAVVKIDGQIVGNISKISTYRKGQQENANAISLGRFNVPVQPVVFDQVLTTESAISFDAALTTESAISVDNSMMVENSIPTDGIHIIEVIFEKTNADTVRIDHILTYPYRNWL